MGLVVALESEPGVAIAGDARVTEDGTIRSEERRRVFDFGTVGVGAVGDGGALDQFQHRFGTALRSQEFEIEQGPDIEGVARIAARQAEHASVDAAVRDVVGTVAQRDADVGGDVEVWTLPADAGGT
ncbi:hypothetical protein BRD08_02055 [Halobacteriales archaeon SW_10_66_29]|nr:MAG: hypothetical protein BRD08_02055 [Halobacteriales archaeon SW_10_66_29]